MRCHGFKDLELFTQELKEKKIQNDEKAKSPLIEGFLTYKGLISLQLSPSCQLQGFMQLGDLYPIQPQT
jgi:hypothetical protein